MTVRTSAYVHVHNGDTEQVHCRQQAETGLIELQLGEDATLLLEPLAALRIAAALSACLGDADLEPRALAPADVSRESTLECALRLTRERVREAMSGADVPWRAVDRQLGLVLGGGK